MVYQPTEGGISSHYLNNRVTSETCDNKIRDNIIILHILSYKKNQIQLTFFVTPLL